MIEAAGGAVWKLTAKSVCKVAIVHRPKHGDWTLPKGKLEPGEDHAAAALREVEEETGFRCKLGPELPETRYHDRDGRPKRVRYWSMEVVSGEFEPNDEVDELLWLPVDEARSKLSYKHDRRVLDALPVASGVGA
jgi:8-oxo-dGTP diphosphatase